MHSATSLPAPTLRRYLERSRNLLLVLCAVSFGILVPQFSQYTQPFVTALVMFLVYSSIRGIDVGDVDATSYGLFVALSLLISYLFLPLGGIRIVNRLFSGGTVIGFAIILSVPTTAGSAIIWTRLSDGDVQLSTFTSIISLLLAPLATPVLLSSLIGGQADVPVLSVVGNLSLIVVGGAVLHGLLPKQLLTDQTVDRGTSLAILVLIYSSVAGLELASIRIVDLLSIGSVSLLLLGVGMVMSVVVGSLFLSGREEVLPLFFTGSLKNLGIALLIAISYASTMVVAVIITYYVLQQLTGAAIADVGTELSERTSWPL